METWEQIRDVWFDDMPEYQEMMAKTLRQVAGADIEQCLFHVNGRWIIATTGNNEQWIWDDTSGDWLVSESDLDED